VLSEGHRCGVSATPSRVMYRLTHPGRPGLIFGYATLDEATIERGVKRLAAALREAT